MKDDTTRPLVKYSFAKTDAGADAAFPKAIKFDLYETLEQAHDAGYDSLMTGLVFASLIGREGLGIGCHSSAALCLVAHSLLFDGRIQRDFAS